MGILKRIFGEWYTGVNKSTTNQVARPDEAGASPAARATSTSVPGIQEGSESARLINSGMLVTFVTQKDGVWNHQDWLNLLTSIRNAGYHTLPEKEVGRILEEAKAKFWRTKWEEATSLGAGAVEPLAAALKHHDATVRRTAAEALAKIQDDRAIEALASYNLTRWKQSGQPRQWVQGHKGSWNHGDWLSLLETLKGSEFWPMMPNAVGAVLEEFKREWHTRERPHQQMPLPSSPSARAFNSFASVTHLLTNQPKLFRGRDIKSTATLLPAGVSGAVLGIILEGRASSDPVTVCRQIVNSQPGIRIFSDMHIFFQETGEMSLTLTAREIAMPHYLLCSGIFFNARNPPTGDFQFFETRAAGARCYIYATYW